MLAGMFKGAVDLDPAASGMVPAHCLWMPDRQLLLVGSVANRPSLLNEAADIAVNVSQDMIIVRDVDKPGVPHRTSFDIRLGVVRGIGGTVGKDDRTIAIVPPVAGGQGLYAERRRPVDHRHQLVDPELAAGAVGHREDGSVDDLGGRRAPVDLAERPVDQLGGSVEDRPQPVLGRRIGEHLVELVRQRPVAVLHECDESCGTLDAGPCLASVLVANPGGEVLERDIPLGGAIFVAHRLDEAGAEQERRNPCRVHACEGIDRAQKFALIQAADEPVHQRFQRGCRATLPRR